jgi:cellobiose-specific phosphotransferase system component IIC
MSMSLTQKVIFFQNQTLEELTEANELSSSTDQQLLIYGGTGATLLFLLFIFFAMRKKQS